MTNDTRIRSHQMMFSTTTFSLNKAREKVRRERVALLKSCISPTSKERRRVVINRSRQSKDWRGSIIKMVEVISTSVEDSTKKEKGYLQKDHIIGVDSQRVRSIKDILHFRGRNGAPVRRFAPTEHIIRADRKSVWKGFTKTFMRNGERLRYQTILRKSLLLL